jgi:hypothetical protein
MGTDKYLTRYEKLESFEVDDFIDIVIKEYAEYAKTLPNPKFNWDKVIAAATIAQRKEDDNV